MPTSNRSQLLVASDVELRPFNDIPLPTRTSAEPEAARGKLTHRRFTYAAKLCAGEEHADAQVQGQDNVTSRLIAIDASVFSRIGRGVLQYEEAIFSNATNKVTCSFCDVGLFPPSTTFRHAVR